MRRDVVGNRSYSAAHSAVRLALKPISTQGAPSDSCVEAAGTFRYGEGLTRMSSAWLEVRTSGGRTRALAHTLSVPPEREVSIFLLPGNPSVEGRGRTRKERCTSRYSTYTY